MAQHHRYQPAQPPLHLAAITTLALRREYELINAETELRVLADVRDSFSAELFLDHQPGVDVSQLLRILGAGCGAPMGVPDVLHFIGHGPTTLACVLMRRAVTTVPLLLPTMGLDFEPQCEYYDPEALVRTLELSGKPRLIVLQACKTAEFAKRIAAAIPQIVIVCWQTKVLDEGCHLFTRVFYTTLLSSVRRKGWATAGDVFTAFQVARAHVTQKFACRDPDVNIAHVGKQPMGVPVFVAGCDVTPDLDLFGRAPPAQAHEAAGSGKAGGGAASGRAGHARGGYQQNQQHGHAPPPHLGRALSPTGSDMAGPWDERGSHGAASTVSGSSDPNPTPGRSTAGAGAGESRASVATATTTSAGMHRHPHSGDGTGAMAYGARLAHETKAGRHGMGMGANEALAEAEGRSSSVAILEQEVDGSASDGGGGAFSDDFASGAGSESTEGPLDLISGLSPLLDEGAAGLGLTGESSSGTRTPVLPGGQAGDSDVSMVAEGWDSTGRKRTRMARSPLIGVAAAASAGASSSTTSGRGPAAAAAAAGPSGRRAATGARPHRKSIVECMDPRQAVPAVTWILPKHEGRDIAFTLPSSLDEQEEGREEEEQEGDDGQDDGDEQEGKECEDREAVSGSRYAARAAGGSHAHRQRHVHPPAGPRVFIGLDPFDLSVEDREAKFVAEGARLRGLLESKVPAPNGLGYGEDTAVGLGAGPGRAQVGGQPMPMAMPMAMPMPGQPMGMAMGMGAPMTTTMGGRPHHHQQQQGGMQMVMQGAAQSKMVGHGGGMSPSPSPHTVPGMDLPGVGMHPPVAQQQQQHMRPMHGQWPAMQHQQQQQQQAGAGQAQAHGFWQGQAGGPYQGAAPMLQLQQQGGHVAVDSSGSGAGHAHGYSSASSSSSAPGAYMSVSPTPSPPATGGASGQGGGQRAQYGHGYPQQQGQGHAHGSAGNGMLTLGPSEGSSSSMPYRPTHAHAQAHGHAHARSHSHGPGHGHGQAAAMHRSIAMGGGGSSRGSSSSGNPGPVVSVDTYASQLVHVQAAAHTSASSSYPYLYYQQQAYAHGVAGGIQDQGQAGVDMGRGQAIAVAMGMQVPPDPHHSHRQQHGLHTSSSSTADPTNTASSRSRSSRRHGGEREGKEADEEQEAAGSGSGGTRSASDAHAQAAAEPSASRHGSGSSAATGHKQQQEGASRRISAPFWVGIVTADELARAPTDPRKRERYASRLRSIKFLLYDRGTCAARAEQLRSDLAAIQAIHDRALRYGSHDPEAGDKCRRGLRDTMESLQRAVEAVAFDDRNIGRYEKELRDMEAEAEGEQGQEQEAAAQQATDAAAGGGTSHRAADE